MRWDAAIHGRLVIPAKQRKAWLAAELDWKSVEGSAALKGYINGETVADMIYDDASFEESYEFLKIAWSGDELLLQSYQSPAGFTENMVGFAAAWAAAARFGGAGELFAFAIGSRLGYRITVADGKVSVVKLVDDELAQLLEHPDAIALREAIAKRGGKMAEKLAAAFNASA